MVSRLADVTVYRSGCTEVVIDMYRSSTPDVPKWSCTDLALPRIYPLMKNIVQVQNLSYIYVANICNSNYISLLSLANICKQC